MFLAELMGDTWETYPDSRHIAVLCRGQIYWFNVYAPDGKSCLPAVSLSDFECIMLFVDVRSWL